MELLYMNFKTFQHQNTYFKFQFLMNILKFLHVCLPAYVYVCVCVCLHIHTASPGVSLHLPSFWALQWRLAQLSSTIRPNSTIVALKLLPSF